MAGSGRHSQSRKDQNRSGRSLRRVCVRRSWTWACLSSTPSARRRRRPSSTPPFSSHCAASAKQSPRLSPSGRATLTAPFCAVHSWSTYDQTWLLLLPAVQALRALRKGGTMTKQEREALRELLAKADEPDAPCGHGEESRGSCGWCFAALED